MRARTLARLLTRGRLHGSAGLAQVLELIEKLGVSPQPSDHTLVPELVLDKFKCKLCTKLTVHTHAHEHVSNARSLVYVGVHSSLTWSATTATSSSACIASVHIHLHESSHAQVHARSRLLARCSLACMHAHTHAKLHKCTCICAHTGRTIDVNGKIPPTASLPCPVTHSLTMQAHMDTHTQACHER